MAPNPRLVVRTYAPLQRMLLVAGIVGLVCLGLYIAFEWGRSNAGFDGRAARRQRAELRDQIGELQAENRRPASAVCLTADRPHRPDPRAH